MRFHKSAEVQRSIDWLSEYGISCGPDAVACPLNPRWGHMKNSALASTDALHFACMPSKPYSARLFGDTLTLSVLACIAGKRFLKVVMHSYPKDSPTRTACMILCEFRDHHRSGFDAFTHLGIRGCARVSKSSMWTDYAPVSLVKQISPRF